MVTSEAKSVIARAKEIYEAQLRTELERNHKDRFVSIEPDSGDYSIDDTFDAAVKQARSQHPTQLSHTIHIGHAAAFHIGAMY